MTGNAGEHRSSGSSSGRDMESPQETPAPRNCCPQDVGGEEASLLAEECGVGARRPEWEAGFGHGSAHTTQAL